MKMLVVSLTTVAMSVAFCGLAWLIWTAVLKLELLYAPLLASTFAGGIIGISAGQWLAERLNG